MHKLETTYNQIIRYLKGLLSNPEKNALEREMIRDTFDDEAFEGLTMLKADELDADMGALMQSLDTRIDVKKPLKRMMVLRVAAALVLLVGVGIVLRMVLKKPAENLISQEMPAVSPPAELHKPVEIPSMPSHVAETGKTLDKQAGTLQERVTEARSAPGFRDENPLEMREIVVPESDAGMVEERADVIEREPSEKRKAVMAKSGIAYQQSISGRVTDNFGQPLPGVTIVVKGTSTGTVTDEQGNYSLQVKDTSQLLAFNYIGFKSAEISAGVATGTNISLIEDIVALNEVVVIGYGTTRKTDLTGVVSAIEADDLTQTPGATEPVYQGPVPPGGSYKAFRTSIEERIDRGKFTGLTGKFRLHAELTIGESGKVREVHIKSKVPFAISAEYEKVLLQSDPWKPALENNQPVESKVLVRFVVEME